MDHCFLSLFHSPELTMGFGGSLCEQWSGTEEEGRQSAPSKSLTQTSPSPALAPANTQFHLEESTQAIHKPDKKKKTKSIKMSRP